MNPFYLLAILAGAYGLSRMSAASVSAAKTAAKSGQGRMLKGPLASGGTPEVQLQATITQAQTLIKDYAASSDRTCWLTTNHNPAVATLNALNKWATLLNVAGQTAAASQGSGYYNAHPELHQYLPALSKLRGIVHALAYQDAAALAKITFAGPASSTSTTAGAKSAKDLITKAQGIISSFPSDGSDASAYVAWIAITAAQVPSLVSDIQSLVASASNPQADIQTALSLIPQLTALVSKATSSAASASSSSSSTSTADTSSALPSTDTSTTPPADPGY